MYKYIRLFVVFWIATMLSACGGSDSFKSTGTTTGTGTDTTTAEIASISVSTASLTTNLAVNGTETIQATVKDSNGDLVGDGTVVAFELVGAGTFTGGVRSLTATTSSGVASVTLTAPRLVGSASITATVEELSDSLTITYTAGAPASVTISASPATVGVASESTITATVRDAEGNVAPYEAVVFSITTNNSGAALTPATGNAITNTNGIASIIYTSGAMTGVSDTIKVSVINGSAPTGSISVNVSASTASITTISLSTASLSTSLAVDGTDTIQATVLDSTGSSAADGTVVAFELTGTGTLTGGVKSLTATTTSGVASVVLTAPKLVGSASVKASVAGLSDSIDLDYTAGVPASATISASSTTVSVLSDSTITAIVRDANGNITPYEPVVFSFTAKPSGALLTPSTGNAVTDAEGVATIIYTSGTTSNVTDTVLVTASNGSSPTATVSVAVVSGAIPAKMTVMSSTSTIKSDNSTSATITATVLDGSNVAVADATVTFAADGGVLTTGSVTTDANGKATTVISAGTDPRNQTITVTASSSGVTDAVIPIEVVGTTLAISATRTNLIIGGAAGTDTATLTIKAADASGTGIYNQTLSLSIDTANSTGTANLSALSGTTDPQGEIEVDLVATTTGTLRVLVTGMNTSTYQDFVIESLAGSLVITSPASGDTAVINAAKTVSIDVPASVADITLVSSLGTWSSGTGAGTNITGFTGVGGTTVTSSLTSTGVGTATIKVHDTSNSAIADSIRLIFVDQTVDKDSSVSLQATPTTVAPSLGASLNSSSLVASVINKLGNPIAGARVTFKISKNSTGSGEYIDPPVAYSDAFGVARASLYSGTKSTVPEGLEVTADLWETVVPTNKASSDSVNIIIGGTSGAIALTPSTVISSVDLDTNYEMAYSAKVVDAAGNPVANADVTLSLWPLKYGTGSWVCILDKQYLYRDNVITNEDVDRNLIMDSTEDDSGNGTLTPPISSAGSIPSIVTTDENGVATFILNYPKNSAGFIYNVLSATTLVAGTETKNSLIFWLNASQDDTDGCLLGESAFNAHWPGVSVATSVVSVNTFGSGSVYATLTDTTGAAMVGETLNASLSTCGSCGLTNASITASGSTDANGQVTFTYTAGSVAGTDVIKVTYTTTLGVVISDYVSIEVL